MNCVQISIKGVGSISKNIKMNFAKNEISVNPATGTATFVGWSAMCDNNSKCIIFVCCLIYLHLPLLPEVLPSFFAIISFNVLSY